MPDLTPEAMATLMENAGNSIDGGGEGGLLEKPKPVEQQPVAPAPQPPQPEPEPALPPAPDMSYISDDDDVPEAPVIPAVEPLANPLETAPAWKAPETQEEETARIEAELERRMAEINAENERKNQAQTIEQMRAADPIVQNITKRIMDLNARYEDNTRILRQLDPEEDSQQILNIRQSNDDLIKRYREEQTLLQDRNAIIDDRYKIDLTHKRTIATQQAESSQFLKSLFARAQIKGEALAKDTRWAVLEPKLYQDGVIDYPNRKPEETTVRFSDMVINDRKQFEYWWQLQFGKLPELPLERVTGKPVDTASQPPRGAATGLVNGGLSKNDLKAAIYAEDSSYRYNAMSPSQQKAVQDYAKNHERSQRAKGVQRLAYPPHIRAVIGQPGVDYE